MYPALAVAAELVASGLDEVAFVGTPSGLEARLATEAGVPFFGLPARGFDRARPWSFVVAGVTALVSTVRAIRLIKRWDPDVVVGFGAYVSVPVGLAAVATRTPLVLHEQNSVPGLANRFLSRWAKQVAVTYETSRTFLRRPDRVVLTGNPVRASVSLAGREHGRRTLGIEDEATVLLVFGGSRGARHVNQAVLAARASVLSIPDVHIVHAAGRAEYDSVVKSLSDGGGDGGGRWVIHDYIEDMGSCIAAADVVVARAGATSLAEITAIGRAAVLVPYPYATDDHQTLNARTMVDGGGAIAFADSEIDGPEFGEAIAALLRDSSARANMAAASRGLGRPDAGARVASVIRDAVSSSSRKGQS